MGDYLAGCWNECGKKCVVDEDEIEIVGPLRTLSNGSGWLPEWLSRPNSALCTPRRLSSALQCDPTAQLGAGAATGATCCPNGNVATSSAIHTGPFPTPRGSGSPVIWSEPASRL